MSTRPVFRSLKAIETLRQFAALNDGVHYLDGEAGVLVGHTLVCGVAGWHEHQAAILARRMREAAADQAIGEIVVVTHAAPHPDGLVVQRAMKLRLGHTEPWRARTWCRSGRIAWTAAS